MNRTSLINFLIRHNGLSSYLEVGTQKKANNFNLISARVKYSVDPDPESDADYKGTSDQFFSENKSMFDIILIDGLHHADQVERDIINSLRCLNPGGFVILHDCNPKEEWQQLVPRQHKVWYGDVWRAFVGFRNHYPEVRSYCNDYDCGCGVITYTHKNIDPGFVSDISWAEFTKNRNELLGIV